ncbi:MAG: hypothetical protein ACP5O1_12395 [Phycisphaerae bacterium]
MAVADRKQGYRSALMMSLKSGAGGLLDGPTIIAAINPRLLCALHRKIMIMEEMSSLASNHDFSL